MNNKIAVVTSTYPNFGPDEALAGISAAGFKYVDMATCPGYFEHILPKPEDMGPDDYKKVLDKVASYNLEMIAVSGHTRMGTENGVQRLKKVMDFTHKAGVSYLVTDAGEDEKRFYEDISQLADYAKDKGITICLEMHGPWLNNGTKGAEVIQKVNHPNVRLNYDTSNVIMYGGVRPETDIDAALPYMAYLHLKDDGSGKKGDWNFPPLGQGLVDFEIIFEKIADYQGPIDVEIEFDGKERTLDEINEAVAQSYQFLKSYGYV